MERALECPNCEQPLWDNRKVKFVTDKAVPPLYELESFYEFKCVCGTRIQIPVEG